MGQVSHGVRKILEVPWVYNFFQRSIQKKSIWADIFEREISLDVDSSRILDIGCGPGNLLAEEGMKIDQSKFVGIDPSQDYVDHATELFPAARFLTGTVRSVDLTEETFDLIIIAGVLHHVDDQEAMEIMTFAHAHKSNKGLILSLDPVFFSGQNVFARWMALADRGQNVRTAKSLEGLWRGALASSDIQISIKSGYLRVPHDYVLCKVSS